MSTQRAAIVTGASRGIGRAIAIDLARVGYMIVVNYRADLRAAEETVDAIHAEGGDALLFRADVSQREGVRAMVLATLERFGRLDLLVNNAGILKQTPFDQITDEEWNQALAVNLSSAFITTQEAAEYLEDDGSIVNVSSVGGQMGGPKAPHYAASKGALITFTKSSARLLAHRGIRVNAVAPGFIRTDMFEHILDVSGQKEDEVVASIPLQRLGTSADVAAAVTFLASSQASYITGQTLNINGGVWMP